MTHPQTIPGALYFRVGDGGITITHADPVIRVSREWLERLTCDSPALPIYGTPECDTNKPHISRVSIAGDNALILYDITSYDSLTRTFILRWPD
jgi:hypothetical protein